MAAFGLPTDAALGSGLPPTALPLPFTAVVAGIGVSAGIGGSSDSSSESSMRAYLFVFVRNRTASITRSET